MRLELSAPGTVAGKRILVTGGSSGYGRALALRLLRDGAKVAACARGKEGLAALAKAGALVVPADVSQPGEVSAMMVLLRDAWGGLDALVNNAAILPRVRLADQGLLDWKRTIEINLTGPWLVTREALELMNGGSIVMVTSGLGWFPMAPYNSYCVSKAGLNMLTQALALELGARYRVNAVDPGVARTRMNPTAETEPDAAVPVLRYLSALGPEGPSGRCFKKDGRERAWERDPLAVLSWADNRAAGARSRSARAGARRPSGTAAGTASTRRGA